MIKERPNDVCWNQCGNCRGGFVVGVGADYSLPISTAWCGAHCVSHAGRSLCAAPVLLVIFQLVPPCRNRCKKDCSPRTKILYTHDRVPRPHWALCCFTVTATCKSLCVPWKTKSSGNNNKKNHIKA